MATLESMKEHCTDCSTELEIGQIGKCDACQGPQNTKFSLLYRDAANYKTYREVVLSGRVTKAQLGVIASKLEGGTFIIAEQVGFPTPNFCDIGNCMWPCRQVDHVWTTLSDFEEAREDGEGLPYPEEMHTDEAPHLLMTVDDFVAKIQAVTEWDVAAEWARMDSAKKAYDPVEATPGIGFYGPSVVPAKEAL